MMNSWHLSPSNVESFPDYFVNTVSASSFMEIEALEINKQGKF